jgi:dTDP-4-dehydrorhamnose reductase
MLKPKTILVTGANGQLGQELKTLQTINSEFHWLFCSRNELDITNLEAVKLFFAENKIDAVINAAAYTKVDLAESDKENAIAGNATAVENLAIICSEKNIFLLHISTDYVFNGENNSPYEPYTNTNPLGVYGYSKWLGEEILKKYFTTKKLKTLILRTSWVYSSFGNNFLKTMVRLMKERNELNVVSDQIGCPTYAKDLAITSIEICKHFFSGNSKSLFENKMPIYHYSNKGKISWFDFAVEIGNQIGYQGKINPIPTSSYPTAAKRPQYSVLSTISLEQDFKINIPAWQESLTKCIKILNER